MRELKPIPEWMKLDMRQMDTGEKQEFGYGYSRKVNNTELWRYANRAIVRRDSKFKNFEIVQLYPGALLVSDHGRIYSRLSGRIIAKRRFHKRHNEIRALLADGIHRIKIRRYRLIIANFLEPPESIRDVIYYLLDTVNHRDSHPWNDRIDNLQYCTRPMNTEHEYKYNPKMKRKKLNE